MDVARWLAARGIVAAVLKYRHAPTYHYPTPLLDAQRGIQLLRSRAGDWGVSLSSIGVLGFSAGGHLAAMVSLYGGEQLTGGASLPDAFSGRPDFAALIYPVVSFVKPYAHRDTRMNLMGPRREPLLAERLSAELAVRTCGTAWFLAHGENDQAVDVRNSTDLADALRRVGTRCECHTFAKGDHGFGLAAGIEESSEWPEMFLDWLTAEGFCTTVSLQGVKNDRS